MVKIKTTKIFKNLKKNVFKEMIMTILSPTYSFAKIIKNTLGFNNYSTTIIIFNWSYLITTAIFVFFLYKINIKTSNWYINVLISLIGYYSFSRMNEVFIAFYNDAVDKMKEKNNDNIGLKYYQRIKLALRSYIELILDYAIFYYLIDKFFLKVLEYDIESLFGNIFDAVYFSGVTITTLGFGDIKPNNSLTKFFSVYEVLNGVLLLVVCFTIYVSLNFSDDGNTPDEKIKSNVKPTIFWLTTVTISFFSFLIFIFYGGDIMKLLTVLGLLLSTIGSVMVGLIANRGIPKKGDIIKAPNVNISFWGWLLIIFGFLFQLISILIS